MTFPRSLMAFAPLAFAAACAATGPAVDGPPQPGVAATVQMLPTLMFAPMEVTIPAGGTVAFENTSAFVHTVSTRPATPEEAADTALPDGAESFNSGDIAPGAVWTQTFDVPGTYRYFCDPHHGAGMIGTIVVTG